MGHYASEMGYTRTPAPFVEFHFIRVNGEIYYHQPCRMVFRLDRYSDDDIVFAREHHRDCEYR